MFGFQTLFVLLLAWLTLFPLIVPLPHISHLLAIFSYLNTFDMKRIKDIKLCAACKVIILSQKVYYEQPVVVPQVSHFGQVPFRTSVK